MPVWSKESKLLRQAEKDELKSVENPMKKCEHKEGDVCKLTETICYKGMQEWCDYYISAKPYDHGVTPPEYYDRCSVQFKRKEEREISEEVLAGWIREWQVAKPNDYINDWVVELARFLKEKGV